MSFDTVLGDLKPMTGQLFDSGAPMVLLLTDTVTLHYLTPTGVTKSKALTITNASLGEWSADWVDGDLPDIGAYRGQITITRTGDTGFPMTHPDDGSRIIWWVYNKIT